MKNMINESNFTVRPPKLRQKLITAVFGMLAVAAGAGVYFATDEYASFSGALCAVFAISAIAMLVSVLRNRIIVDSDTITDIPSFGKKIQYSVRDITGAHIYDGQFIGVPVMFRYKEKTICINFGVEKNIELPFRSKNVPLLVAWLKNKGVKITENITRVC